MSRSATEVRSAGRSVDTPLMSPSLCVVGAAKANEVLIWGKKKEAAELLECGFIK